MQFAPINPMLKKDTKETFLILHDFTFELQEYVHIKECMIGILKKRLFPHGVIDATPIKWFSFQQIIVMCTTTFSFPRDIVKLNTIATLDFGGFLTLNALLINHKLLESMKWPYSRIHEN